MQTVADRGKPEYRANRLLLQVLVLATGREGLSKKARPPIRQGWQTFYR